MELLFPVVFSDVFGWLIKSNGVFDEGGDDATVVAVGAVFDFISSGVDSGKGGDDAGVVTASWWDCDSISGCFSVGICVA